MTETPVLIPWAPGAQYTKVICRLGEPRPDGSDVDEYPDLMTQGGTVTITCAAKKIRYSEPDGKARMLTTRPWTFKIRPSDGELHNPENGAVGVYVLSGNSAGLDPAGFTWSATVTPDNGESWTVTIPADAGTTVDLVSIVDIAIPSAGESTLSARVAALEASSGGGGLNTESVQDIVGAMVEGAGGTYDDTAGTITLPAGGGGGVSSVAGRTGDVTLSSADLTDADTLATGAELTAGLAGKADSFHTHTLADVTDYAAPDLSGYVTTTDPRLSDARTPTAHTHPASAISDSTATGRSVLTAADAAAARTAIGAGTSNLGIGTTGTTAAAGNRQATETATGMVELATTAEATAGTDTSRAVTPAGVKAVADTKAASTHTHDDRYYTEAESDARYLQTAAAQPINAQTGTTYTLVASDAGKLVTLTNAAAITLTVPGAVFTAGQRVDIGQRGAGAVTVVAGSGMTVNPPPGGSLVMQGQYAYASLVLISATVADLVGLMAAP